MPYIVISEHVRDQGDRPATSHAVAVAALAFSPRLDDHPTLSGIAVHGWTLYRSASGAITVSYPSRMYTVRAARHRYTLVRPIDTDTHPDPCTALTDAIVRAYHLMTAQPREPYTVLGLQSFRPRTIAVDL